MNPKVPCTCKNHGLEDGETCDKEVFVKYGSGRMSADCTKRVLDFKTEGGVTTFVHYRNGLDQPTRVPLYFTKSKIPPEFTLPPHYQARLATCPNIQNILENIKEKKAKEAARQMKKYTKMRANPDSREQYNKRHRKRYKTQKQESIINIEQGRDDWDEVTESNKIAAIEAGESAAKSAKAEGSGVYAFSASNNPDGTVQKNEDKGFLVQTTRNNILFKRDPNSPMKGTHFSVADIGGLGSGCIIESSVEFFDGKFNGVDVLKIEHELINGLENGQCLGYTLNQGKFGRTLNDGKTHRAGFFIIHNLKKQLRAKHIGFNANLSEDVKRKISANLSPGTCYFLEPSSKKKAQLEQSKKYKKKHYRSSKSTSASTPRAVRSLDMGSATSSVESKSSSSSSNSESSSSSSAATSSVEPKSSSNSESSNKRRKSSSNSESSNKRRKSSSSSAATSSVEPSNNAFSKMMMESRKMKARDWNKVGKR